MLRLPQAAPADVPPAEATATAALPKTPVVRVWPPVATAASASPTTTPGSTRCHCRAFGNNSADDAEDVVGGNIGWKFAEVAAVAHHGGNSPGDGGSAEQPLRKVVSRRSADEEDEEAGGNSSCGGAMQPLIRGNNDDHGLDDAMLPLISEPVPPPDATVMPLSLRC